MSSSACSPATLGDLLREAVPYREWRAPIDPALCHATRLAGATVGLLAAVLLPIAVASASPIAVGLFAVNLMAFAAFLVALVFTFWLQAGRRIWHRVCFGVVVVAAPQGFVLSVAAVALAVVVVLGALAALACLLSLLTAPSSNR